MPMPSRFRVARYGYWSKRTILRSPQITLVLFATHTSEPYPSEVTDSARDAASHSFGIHNTNFGQRKKFA